MIGFCLGFTTWPEQLEYLSHNNGLFTNCCLNNVLKTKFFQKYIFAKLLKSAFSQMLQFDATPKKFTKIYKLKNFQQIRIFHNKFILVMMMIRIF